MPASTFRDQFIKLVDKGYLVQRSDGSNIYQFYETPQRVAQSKREEANAVEPSPTAVHMNESAVHQTTAKSREIDNINKKDMIYNCGGEKQVSHAPTERKFVF